MPRCLCSDLLLVSHGQSKSNCIWWRLCPLKIYLRKWNDLVLLRNRLPQNRFGCKKKNIRKQLFSAQVMEHWHTLHRGCGISSLEIFTWTWARVPFSGVPAWTGVGQGDLRRSLPSSVILCDCEFSCLEFGYPSLEFTGVFYMTTSRTECRRVIYHRHEPI